MRTPLSLAFPSVPAAVRASLSRGLIALVALAAIVSSLALAACAPPPPVIAVELGADDHLETVVFEDAENELALDDEGAGPVQEAAAPFARLGARWSSPAAPGALHVRTSVDGEAWSEWLPLEVYFSEEGAHAGHVDVVAADGSRPRFFQHRIVKGELVPTFVAFELLPEIPPAIPEGAVEDDGIDAQASTAEQGLNLGMVTRAQWGARAPNCKSFTGVRKATIHHTAGANDDTTPSKVQMRQIQAFHMFTRGWCDVGYNFLVARDGSIFEGRGYGVLGAHAANANGDNMGISFIGTYTSATPPEAQFVAAAKVLRYLKDRAGIPLTRSGDNGVKGHRQRGTTSTSCPGDKLYSMLGTLVNRAKNGDFSVGPPLPVGCRSGNSFDGAFCDDDGASPATERAHDRLKRELDVNFHCSNINGKPAYCGKREVTRAQMISVLGRAAGMPTNGHPNAFTDDNGHANERSLNAARAFGIIFGNGDRKVNPNGKAVRSTIAVVLKRMYKLPPADRDYFDDDDGHGNEDAHNRVAAAGLMGGYSDSNGGRRDFKPGAKADRSTLAIVAVRAHDKGLIPVWDIPEACLSGNYDGHFCDDDNNANAQASFDRLIDEAGLPGMFCSELAGSPRFCPTKAASRAMSVLILTGSAGMPLAGHPDAFRDDDDHPRERWFNAAKAFGIIGGYEGGTKMKPSEIATRNTMATILARMYRLPPAPAGVDYFTDDDGTASEALHNKVGHAGLFAGVNDGNGGRAFKGGNLATKGQLATLAARADQLGLVPVWLQDDPAPSTVGDDPALDTDTVAAAEDAAAEDDGTVEVSTDPLDLADDPLVDDEVAIDDVTEDDSREPLDPALEQDLHFEPSVGAAGCSNAGAPAPLVALMALALVALRRARVRR